MSNISVPIGIRSGKIVTGMIDEVMMLKEVPGDFRAARTRIFSERRILFLYPTGRSPLIAELMPSRTSSCFPCSAPGICCVLKSAATKGTTTGLLEKAGLPFPEPIEAEDINQLVMVKLPHAVKTLERGFFTAASYEEYCQESRPVAPPECDRPGWN